MTRRTVEQRINEKYVILANGCWEWTGSLDEGGYSMMWYEGRSRRAHIVSYELVRGKVPCGLQLDHICHKPSHCEGGDNCRHRRCINPDHLEAVTKEENGKRGWHRPQKWFAIGHEIQRSKTHCPSGHEYTSENTARRKKDNSRRCKTCDRLYQRSKLSHSTPKTPLKFL